MDGFLGEEIVKIRLVECRKNYGRGELLVVEKISSDRIQPPCPLFNRCGGCQLMHLSYPKQLEIKRERIIDALIRIGKLNGIKVAPCLPSPREFSYRNKIQLPVKEGKLGLYERSSHRLVELTSCSIHSPLGEEVYQHVCPIIQRSNIPLRHVLIKSTLRSKEALVILVSKERGVALSVIADEMMAACPHIKGVIHNCHSGPDNVILGKTYTILKGQGSIFEILSGLTFNISPASFFQVNPLQAEHLYAKALALAELTGKETVLDAYCGVGTLALLFAQHAKHVIGVECVAEAIQDAKENGKRNGITNVHFICSTSESFIVTSPPVDVVLLNPPRKGCEASFLDAMGRLLPKKVIYISCDQATLARDLGRLSMFGYKVEEIQPFDMFPQTSHVECVAKVYILFLPKTKFL